MQADFLIIFMPEQINPRVLPFWSMYPAVALECKEQVKPARQPLPTTNADAPWIQNGPLWKNNNNNTALNIWCPPPLPTEAMYSYRYSHFNRSTKRGVFFIYFNFHVDCIIFFLLSHVVIVFLSSHICAIYLAKMCREASAGILCLWNPHLPLYYHTIMPKIISRLLSGESGDICSWILSSFAHPEVPKHTDLCFALEAWANIRSLDLALQSRGWDIVDCNHECCSSGIGIDAAFTSLLIYNMLPSYMEFIYGACEVLKWAQLLRLVWIHMWAISNTLKVRPDQFVTYKMVVGVVGTFPLVLKTSFWSKSVTW